MAANMKLLIVICLILGHRVACSFLPAVELETGSACSENDQDNVCHITGLTMESIQNVPLFPKVTELHLDNCTFDYFSPHLTTKVSNATESLHIIDGSTPKVYLKPSLQSFTVLRAGSSEIVIDAQDNHQLEILDVEGKLRSVPDNVQHLKMLVTLDLCQNQIESWSVTQLDGLKSLRKLNLGHNRIRTVACPRAVTLPALEELFLHGNLLETLDFSNLRVDRLKRLYVSQNRLLRIGGFPEPYGQLKRVDLDQNDWDCDWLERVLLLLNGREVETLSYLPAKVCDERGSVRVGAISCNNKL